MLTQLGIRSGTQWKTILRIESTKSKSQITPKTLSSNLYDLSF